MGSDAPPPQMPDDGPDRSDDEVCKSCTGASEPNSNILKGPQYVFAENAKDIEALVGSDQDGKTKLSVRFWASLLQALIFFLLSRILKRKPSSWKSNRRKNGNDRRRRRESAKRKSSQPRRRKASLPKMVSEQREKERERPRDASGRSSNRETGADRNKILERIVFGVCRKVCFSASEEKEKHRLLHCRFHKVSFLLFISNSFHCTSTTATFFFLGYCSSCIRCETEIQEGCCETRSCSVCF
jgi:hypothetical protein